MIEPSTVSGTTALTVRDLYARVGDELGRIDVMFNNAGVNDPRDGSALDISLETWSRVQAANLTR
jgi:NAD(P)-dependent dehydrogenase (short-subunit alcohol dehydrogenase family)